MPPPDTASSPALAPDQRPLHGPANGHADAHPPQLMTASSASLAPLAVQQLVRARIPTKHGEYTLALYRSSRDPAKEHMALVFGDLAAVATVRLRPPLHLRRDREMKG
jgi:hypothetical protein